MPNPWSSGRRSVSGCFLVALIVVLGPARLLGQDEMTLEAKVAELFARSCTQSGCHSGPNPQMGMALTPDLFYATTVGESSAENPNLKRVDPGSPETSYLIKKVRGDEGIVGARMPLIGDRLAEEEVELIMQWISELSDADEDRKEMSMQQHTAYPFDGWKAVNLPTSLTLDKGSWLFLISHRFNPKINDGYDALYGLDGSGIIYLSMGYAVTDNLLIALARSNSNDNVELQGRYRIAEQRGSSPLGVGGQLALNWVSEAPPEGESRFRGDAFKLTGQVTLAHQVGRVGVAVVPGITLNPAENVSGEDPLVTVGLAGKWTFHQLARTRFSLVGEWVPIVAGYTRTTTFGNDIRFDTWGGGIEISIGGHVFQVVVSNSVGLTSDQYLRGGDLDIADGEMRLGFNIFRILNL